MTVTASVLILGINIVSAFLFHYSIEHARKRNASRWLIYFYLFLLGVNVGLAALSILNLVYWLGQ